MNASKKYQYQPLSLSTTLHSLYLMLRVFLRVPEVILMFLFFGAFGLLNAVSVLVILYGLCKSGFIDESFKGNWLALKGQLIAFLGIFLLLIVLWSILGFFDGEPFKERGSAQLGLYFFIFIFIKLPIVAVMTALSGEVYDKYNGQYSSVVALVRDKSMLVFVCGSILIIELAGFMFVAYGSPFMVVMSKALIVIPYFILIAHLYTPESPKKTGVQPGSSIISKLK